MLTVSGDLTGRSLITTTKLTRSLGRATQRGVKVYGVVYDDVAFLSSNDSSHTVSALEKVNPDMIKIMRHPDHLDLETIVDFKDALYWSHHDKAVIIDDKTVFWADLILVLDDGIIMFTPLLICIRRSGMKYGLDRTITMLELWTFLMSINGSITCLIEKSNVLNLMANFIGVQGCRGMVI